MENTLNLLDFDEKTFINNKENYRIYNVDTLDKMYHEIHEHNFLEIFILLSGNVDYTIDQGMYQLKDYDIIIVPPHKLHKLAVHNSDTPYKRMVLWVSKSYLEKLSSTSTDLYDEIFRFTKNENYLIRNPEFTFFIKPYLHSIIQLEKEGLYGTDILIENKIKEFFVLLNRFLIDKQKNNVRAITNPIVTEVVKYIKENLSGDLSLPTIASALNFDASYISHTFTNVMGTTLHKYIIKKRLNEAKKLLEQNKSVKEIVTLIGFNDESHFIQVFKKVYGCTPRQYKARANS